MRDRVLIIKDYYWLVCVPEQYHSFPVELVLPVKGFVIIVILYPKNGVKIRVSTNCCALKSSPINKCTRAGTGIKIFKHMLQ